MILLLLVLPLALGHNEEEQLLYGHFPDGFKWGTATAAYQIEGGWNEDGKAPNIWDTFTKVPGNIDDGSSGNVACDSYHKYKDDVQLLKNLGLTSYRFSISWARVLNNGVVNQPGIDYYNAVIDELLAAGIEPAVTLYHWDLPQALQDQGGWLNATVADWFEDYARLCFREFGDRIKFWITLNEPSVTAVNGHGTGEHAPGFLGIGTMTYIAAHNQIRAHARAYRVYKNEFSHQGGQIGITLAVNWAEPEDPSDPTHQEASENNMMFTMGWYSEPILGEGNYPAIMREKVDAKSIAQGFEESRLPHFTEEEQQMNAGSSDFIGINMYTAFLQRPGEEDINDVSYFTDDDIISYQDSTWYVSGSSWLKVTPWGLRKLMNWIKNHYGDISIYITENGFSDKLGNLDDLHRLYYYKHYINQLLKAIVVDEVNVAGYYAWSLMDNFEWARGYTEKFGIHRVNMSDPDRQRTPKESAGFFKQIVEENGFKESVGPCSNY